MKKIIIEIPDAVYEKALELARKLNIGFDELCSMGVRELAEEHLKQDDESGDTSSLNNG